ncbi:MAG: single-stranded DNA-binding protein [Candidatus Pacebacteria bacterium]|nr:single-stranded DNA-binding protein [Candidatus Paceibacterota bacterium]
MNLNKVFIIGNMTRDPELRTLPSGSAVASFGVATNRVWINKTGEKQQEVQFHNIVAFGKQAEIVAQYLKKGAMILVEGRLNTRNWEAQDGTKKTRTEIVMEKMQMGPRRDAEFSGNRSQENTSKNPGKTGNDTLDTIEYPDENGNPDDIPF